MTETPKPGSIVHVEFAVKDPKKVKDFYGNLFGWKFEEVPGESYWMAQAPGGPGLGVGPLQEGQQTGILNYVLVPSIDDYVKKIEKAGGKIVMPKLKVLDQGWMAWFEDPAGARMGLWQVNPAAEQR